MTGMRVGNNKTHPLNLLTVVDTGSGSASIPKQIWLELFRDLKFEVDPINNDVYVNCKKAKDFPSFTMEFGTGNSITIAGKDLLLPNDECKCSLVFSPKNNDESNTIVLGAPFLAQFFTVYDYTSSSINFYETKQQKDADKCY